MTKTKNYNQIFPSRRILLCLIPGPLSIETIGEAVGIEDINKLTHLLAQLRWRELLLDVGLMWQLTPEGQLYAEWCAEYPQRFQRTAEAVERKTQ